MPTVEFPFYLKHTSAPVGAGNEVLLNTSLRDRPTTKIEAFAGYSGFEIPYPGPSGGELGVVATREAVLIPGVSVRPHTLAVILALRDRVTAGSHHWLSCDAEDAFREVNTRASCTLLRALYTHYDTAGEPPHEPGFQTLLIEAPEAEPLAIIKAVRSKVLEVACGLYSPKV